MALADLLVRIGVDTNDFSKGLNKFSSDTNAAVSSAASSVSAASGKIVSASAASSEAIAKQKAQLLDLGQQYAKGAISAQAFVSAAGNTVDLTQSGTATARLDAEVGKLTRRFDAGRISLSEYQARLGTLKAAQDEAAASAVKARTQFVNLSDLGGRLQSAGAGLTAALSLPIAGFVAASTQAFAQIDSLKRGLFTLEKSAEGTERRFRQLQEVAKLPGLGLEEAVRGDIRLRAIGLSSETSRRALLAFGNALASVGSGKADLDETIRQFGQLATASTLTAENLKPIIERVPQAAQILRTAFGTANAEKLRELGITSEQVVAALLRGLEELPKVTGGIKNALETFSDDTKIALAEAGAAFAPFAEKALSGLSQVIGIVPQLAGAFRDLPGVMQTVAAAIAGVAFVGPVAIVAIGTVLGNITEIVNAVKALNTALAGIGGVAGLASTALRALPFVGLATGIFLAVDALNSAKSATENVTRAQEQQTATTQALIDKNREAIAAQISYGGVVEQSGNKSREFVDRIFAIGKAKDAIKPKIQAITKEHQEGAKAVEQHNAAYTGFKRSTLESQFLIGRQNKLLADYRKRYEEIREAQIKVAQGPIVADFGEIPDISVKLEVSDISIPNASELDSLQSRIKALSVDDQISQVQAQERARATSAQIKRMGDAYKTAGSVGSRAMREVSTVLTNLSQGIGQAIFSGESFGRVFERIGRQVGASITAFIIQELLRASGILDAFSRTLSGVIKNITGSVVQQTSGAVIPRLPDILPGDISNKIPSLPGPGGAGTAAGGAASAASSGLLGAVGAIGAAVSAVSGVFSNFQLAKQESSLNAIALHTLQTANDLANLRRDEFVRKDELFTKLDSLFQFTWVKVDELINSVRNIGSIPLAATAGAPTSVNNFQLSAFVAPGGEAQFFDWFAAELRRRRLIP